MQAELDKVEEVTLMGIKLRSFLTLILNPNPNVKALFAHLKRVEKANIDGINEQIAFCDSLISDIDEGIALGIAVTA